MQPAGQARVVYSPSNCDTLLSVYVITSADACNGGAAAVPAIVPQPAAAVSNSSPVPVPVILGAVFGSFFAVAVVLLIVFRRRIIDAAKRWKSNQRLSRKSVSEEVGFSEEQRNRTDQVVMRDNVETP